MEKVLGLGWRARRNGPRSTRRLLVLAFLAGAAGLAAGVVGASEASAASDNFSWPVSGTVPAGDVAWHVKNESGARAVDIGAGEAAPVVAAQSGVIVTANRSCPDTPSACGDGFGNYVVVRHDRAGVSKPLYTLYAHMAASSVTAQGTSVATGALLGRVSLSGHTDGLHTHFAIGTCPTPWTKNGVNCTIWTGPDTVKGSVSTSVAIPGSYPQLVAVGAPSVSGVTFRNGGVAVSFSAPVVPTGVPIRRYLYERSCDGGTTRSGSGTATGTTSPVIVGGSCPQGSLGSYRIAAQTDAATGSWSAWRAVGPSIAAPVAKAGVFRDGGVAVSFTPPAVPTGATIRRYLYERSCNGGVTRSGSGTATGATSPVVVGGSCPQGTLGSYRIAAQLDATTGGWSGWTTVGPAIAPALLRGVTYRDGGVAVTFAAPDKPTGATIRRYVYERSCDGGVTRSGSGTATGATSPVIVGGSCPQGTLGSYRIAAQLDATTGGWSAWNRVFPPVTAPSIGSATYRDGGVAVSFTRPPVPTGATIRRYLYERSCNGGVTRSGSGTATGAASPVIVGGSCPQGTLGSYRIAAQLDATTSGWSGWTTVGPAIGRPTVTKVGTTSSGATVTFTKPSVPTGSTIRRYLYERSCDGGVTRAGSGTATGAASPVSVPGNCSTGAASFRIAAQLDATTGAWSNWRAAG